MTSTETQRLLAYHNAAKHAPKFRGVSRRTAKAQRFSKSGKRGKGRSAQKVFLISLDARPWLA